MNGGKKGFRGAPASVCPGLIQQVLEKNGISSITEICTALDGKYHRRTIQLHVKALMEEKKITSGMRRGTDMATPLYRIVDAKPKIESEAEYQARIDREETYERIRDEP